MPYRNVGFAKGCYYHIYSRGNDKRDIFCAKGDYSKFCRHLFLYAKIHSIAIIGYCLLRYHYHLLLRQDGGDSVSKFIHKLEVSHAMYFNRKYKRTGHLFEGPFKAKLIEDDSYLLTLSAYIHLNPWKHKEVKFSELENYPWSSYRSYLNYRHDLPVEKDLILDMAGGISDYRNLVARSKQRLVDLSTRPGLDVKGLD